MRNQDITSFEVFEKYILDQFSFTAQEIATIKSYTTVKKLKRKQYLLRPGDICRHHAFVAKGCLRSYRMEDDGIEHVLAFATVNDWMTDEMSLFAFKPTLGYIDALEDSEVIQISADDYRRLLKTMPSFEGLQQKLTIENMMKSCERIYSMVSRQAEDRYRDFKLRYPELNSRLPLYMIASYLGVTRETLTRIRANQSQSR